MILAPTLRRFIAPATIALPMLFAGHASALDAAFQINDFAGPPNANYPTAISAAPNGDVYVSSDRNGSLGHGKNMGKIVLCRDTDGDGKADKFIDYIPDLDSPRGGHLAGGVFYVIHPPYLSSFVDKDGDGVADEKKQLVDGLGGGIEHPRGADHTTNAVRMGIDGWLYIAVGDFGMFGSKGTDGTRVELFGGGIARVRPDGSELETFAIMTRNNCDMAIAPTLDMFTRDNTNDGKGWNTRFHHFTNLRRPLLEHTSVDHLDSFFQRCIAIQEHGARSRLGEYVAELYDIANGSDARRAGGAVGASAWQQQSVEAVQLDVVDEATQVVVPVEPTANGRPADRGVEQRVQRHGCRRRDLMVLHHLLQRAVPVVTADRLGIVGRGGGQNGLAVVDALAVE